ncbi:MAG: replicative DNA helicase [Tannerellaceae bacterium]|nr:replicative DNA helicase [Tannerellaceae bacterium]
MNKQQYTSSPKHTRMMPGAIEMEEAVLGALLLESQAYEEIEGIITDTDFYRTEHQILFKHIEQLHRERKAVDILTVTEELKRNGQLEAVGGVVYICTLTNKVASTSHICSHAWIIKEKSIFRQLIQSGQTVVDKAYEGVTEIDELLSEASHGFEKLMEQLIGNSNGHHLSESLKKAAGSLRRRIELARGNIRSGVDTGLVELNRITNGWQASELIILAARPAMGKTALLLHFAKKAALSGVPVAIFSLEMSEISLANRLILSECNVDAEKFKSGYLTNEEVKQIEAGIAQLYNLPVYVDDNPTVTMSYIRHRCKLLKKQNKCGLILVDYLQLAGADSKENNREQEVAKMSRMAKITAKELDVPYILLSQLNRANETRADKKPLMSDLRESGAIEQDADIVCFIHRPQYYGIKVYNETTRQEETNYGELIIAKHRNGATGTVKFKHNNAMTKFYDYRYTPDDFNAADFDRAPY